MKVISLFSLMRTDHFLKYSTTLSLIFRLTLSPAPQSLIMLSSESAANLPPSEQSECSESELYN